MLAKEKRSARIRRVLRAGEVVLAFEMAALEVGSPARRAAKDIGISAAASVVTGAIGGFGLSHMSAPPSVWLVVTDTRLLMFGNDTASGGLQKPSDLIFDAPLEALDVREEKRGIAIADRASGDILASLEFGLRKRAKTAVAQALRQTS